ncbi:hypothetical protein [Mycolicibacterium hodleri]|uniref:hypothetical protein n=1 Tax=Mycolicibacterium hodleri TaxID=49897 RepID=UPI001375AE4F|nr:hypothetical protein [Mycolicibacterium hodleri]
MHLRRVICASAVVVGVGLSALTAGAGLAAAQPGGPPPCGPQGAICQGPGGPGRPDDRGGPDGPRGFGGPNGPARYRGGPGGPEWGPPPPDLGWRGIDQGRFDHQPFNYRGRWVQPIFNQDFRNWGFWFFGIWIPL